jgi:hypothetical protein
VTAHVVAATLPPAAGWQRRAPQAPSPTDTHTHTHLVQPAQGLQLGHASRRGVQLKRLQLSLHCGSRDGAPRDVHRHMQATWRSSCRRLAAQQLVLPAASMRALAPPSMRMLQPTSPLLRLVAAGTPLPAQRGAASPLQAPSQLRKLVQEVAGPGGAGDQGRVTGGHPGVCCQVAAGAVRPARHSLLPLSLCVPALAVRRVCHRLLAAGRRCRGCDHVWQVTSLVPANSRRCVASSAGHAGPVERGGAPLLRNST